MGDGLGNSVIFHHDSSGSVSGYDVAGPLVDLGCVRTSRIWEWQGVTSRPRLNLLYCAVVFIICVILRLHITIIQGIKQ